MLGLKSYTSRVTFESLRASKLNTMEKFMVAAHDAAKSIREGSLLVEPIEKWAQVHRSSWEPLAKINDLGLITFSSQDAITAETGRINPYERPFIEGIIPTERAEEFVQKLNIFTDKVAYRHASRLEPGMKLSEQLIQPSIVVTRWPGEDRSYFQRGMALHLDNKKRALDKFKEQFHVPDEIDVTVVSMIDPKWGRPARSKRGLFADVMKALTPGEFKWEPNEFLRQRYLEWKSQGR